MLSSMCAIPGQDETHALRFVSQYCNITWHHEYDACSASGERTNVSELTQTVFQRQVCMHLCFPDLQYDISAGGARRSACLVNAAKRKHSLLMLCAQPDFQVVHTTASKLKPFSFCQTAWPQTCIMSLLRTVLR